MKDTRPRISLDSRFIYVLFTSYKNSVRISKEEDGSEGCSARGAKRETGHSLVVVSTFCAQPPSFNADRAFFFMSTRGPIERI